MSNSLRPHELQHAGIPCLSPTPGACSNSCPLSQWCPPNISSSVTPFSSHPQSFPASGSFPMSHHFASDGQSVEASTSASVLPVNIQDWFPLGLTGLIPLLSKGLSRVFSSITVQKHQFFSAQPWSKSMALRHPNLRVQLSHVYVTTEKTIALTVWTFVGKVMSLLVNMLSRCHSFSSKEQVSFNFMAAVPRIWWWSYLATDALIWQTHFSLWNPHIAC